MRMMEHGVLAGGMAAYPAAPTLKAGTNNVASSIITENADASIQHVLVCAAEETYRTPRALDSSG